jgi:hypothetical protein
MNETARFQETLRLGLTAPEAVGHQKSHLHESRAAPALGPRLVRQDESLRPEA